MPQPSSLKISRIAHLVLILSILGSLFHFSRAQADDQPWMDKSQPPQLRAQLLLAAMTLEEKIALVHGGSAGSGGYVGHIPAIPRLGIPELNLHDGPAGVAGGALGATAFPAPITVAASWNTTLMEQYGAAMAEEERDKGINVHLAPMMNIARVPFAGRNFEGYGEDPYLSAQMAAAAIRGIQNTGVLAVAKHYIGNEQEIERMTASSEIDIRTQHEIYLPPFKAAVNTSVASIMCAYNKVNGVYACENPDTQNTILKDELKFKGWIMSDWGATHSTAASALGGLDMEMPGGPNYVKLKEAIESGEVQLSRLDDMVLRILTQMFRFGLFERGKTGTYGTSVRTDAHTKLARDAAAEGIVLLKNTDALLPLDPAKVRSIVVFGTAADEEPVVVGGGSGSVSASYVISPLQGITERAGSDVQVHYFTTNNAAGLPIPASVFKTPTGEPGLLAEYFSNADLKGQPAVSQTDANIDFDWKNTAPVDGIAAGAWSARWSGSFTAAVSGRYNIAVSGPGTIRVYVNDNLLLENINGQTGQPKLVRRRYTAGDTKTIRVEYSSPVAGGGLKLSWAAPDTDRNIEAAALAAKADANIIVVGTSSSEGVDRPSIDLPDAALIEAVTKANPRTIVVVYNPSQTLLPWADQAGAILIGWLPGQESGHALADVLFGDINPSGKLPVTYARNLADYPANTEETYPGKNGQVLYSEGLRVGYRHFDSRNIEPLYPFGHGLSYTTFEYGPLNVSPVARADHSVLIRMDIKNTGQRAGAEVVQLYLGLPVEASEPPQQLKNFQKVSLQPGETKNISFVLTIPDYLFWSAGLGEWVNYPGSYTIMVGSSSRDIRQRGTFEILDSPLGGTITQAESATLSGDVAITKDVPGYMGDGFVNGFQKEGAAASFKVNADLPGQYYLTVRYASTLRPGQQNTPRTLSLYINGAKFAQTKLTNLANWEMWDFASEIVKLNAGENTITYQYDSGDSGDVHLDAIILAKVDDGLGPDAVPDNPTVTPVLTPAAAPTQIPTTTDSTPVVLIALVILGLIVLVIVFWQASQRKK